MAVNFAKSLLRGILNGDRASLARAITLVESKHPNKKREGQWILSEILLRKNRLLQAGKKENTFRIGLTGSPGAGKSTLIEHFGQLLTSKSHKVAVLAVDPTSSRSGGSILGDKTRMQRLARDPRAFIRPSPSSGTLGGVTRTTNDVILLCEAAGYDIVLVETIGVGQSEVAVSNMVDMFVLLVPPGAGDELQGMKKGVVELADLVLVTKADGDLLPAARRIQAEFISALKLMTPPTAHWYPQVLPVSALQQEGMEGVWSAISEYKTAMEAAGLFDDKRRSQRDVWMWSYVEEELLQRFQSDSSVAQASPALVEQVRRGVVTPGQAAEQLLDCFLRHTNWDDNTLAQ